MSPAGVFRLLRRVMSPVVSRHAYHLISHTVFSMPDAALPLPLATFRHACAQSFARQPALFTLVDIIRDVCAA